MALRASLYGGQPGRCKVRLVEEEGPESVGGCVNVGEFREVQRSGVTKGLKGVKKKSVWYLTGSQ